MTARSSVRVAIVSGEGCNEAKIVVRLAVAINSISSISPSRGVTLRAYSASASWN